MTSTRPTHRLALGLAALLVLAGCDKSPTDTYVEMSTAAQMGDVDGFLAGFTKDSKSLVEAQIVLSEAYGMNDLNPYRLLVFDSIESEKVHEKGKVPGKKYKCPKECAILRVFTDRKKRKILLLKTKDGWRIDTKELEDYWKKEKRKWK